MNNYNLSVNDGSKNDHVYKVLATYDINKLAYKITANEDTFARIGYLKDFSSNAKIA